MGVMNNKMGITYSRNQLELMANSQKSIRSQIGENKNIQLKENTHDLEQDYKKYIQECDKNLAKKEK